LCARFTQIDTSLILERHVFFLVRSRLIAELTNKKTKGFFLRKLKRVIAVGRIDRSKRAIATDINQQIAASCEISIQVPSFSLFGNESRELGSVIKILIRNLVSARIRCAISLSTTTTHTLTN
jgi:hypothetical protein